MDSARELEPGGKGAVGEPPAVVLCLRAEKLMRCTLDGFAESYEEVELPVLSLVFRYGAVSVRSSDPSERVFVPRAGGLDAVDRAADAEAAARRLLESFGAVEIGCVGDLEPSFDSSADYVVRVDGDVHAYCSFGAYALPQLRALGWEVHVDDDYPYRVLSGDIPWYADVAPDDKKEDWFNLELGVSLDGQRINLLPALLSLLDQTRDGGNLAGLSRIASRCVALPVGDQLYLPLPALRLKTMLAVLRDLYEPSRRGRMQLSLSRHDAAELVALDEAFASSGQLRWRGGHEVRSFGRALTEGPRVAQATPSVGLHATLRPYQREGVAWLEHLRNLGVGGVLADDMGLGKTLQTIAHLLAERDRGRSVGPSLVVAPTSLVGNWARELKRFAPSMRVVVLHGPKRHRRRAAVADADVVITSYPLLWRDLDHFREQRFDIVVLDEAQAIKNARSRAHRAARAIDAEQRIALTGTPLENHLGELHAIFDFLMPGVLGSVEQFRARYRVPIEMGDGDRLEQLRRRVAPFILRRLKINVAKELPPKTEVVRPIDLGEQQRELYESIRIAAHADVRKAIRKKGLAASTVPVLDALMKLRQVCCDPRLVRVPEARTIKRSAKLEVLMELLEQLVEEGRKVLVFSQFTSMLRLVSEELLAKGIGHLTLTGSTQNRQERVDAFQAGRADVFLISLKAGGTGLTLTRADTVVHYDPWWNPAAQSQATDRAYRIGQTNPVFVYKLIVAGSVEERMLQLQQRKQELADAILAGTAQPTRLADEDVEELFAPLED